MPGYLQRLSASAQKRPNRVHPMPSALFAAPSTPADRLREYTLERETTLPEAPASGQRGATLSALGKQTEHVAPETEKRQSRADARILSDSRMEKAEEPFLVKLPERKQETPHIEPLFPTSEQELGVEPLTIRSKEATTSERAPKPLFRNPLQTLVPQERIPAEVANSPARSNFQNPPANARFASRQTASARQSDTIQIHIGRVEVTAVQPAPIPMSKPKRQTPSLDDYLKRGRS